MGKKTVKTRSRKSQVDEYCSFPVEIEDWSVSYSFGLSGNKRLSRGGPYSEHMSLKLTGKLLHPPKLAGKTIEVTILADRRETEMVQEPQETDFEPRCVGCLTARGQRTPDFLGSIPFDAFPVVTTLLSSGNMRYIHFHGRALFRGESLIRYMRFEKEIDPEDY